MKTITCFILGVGVGCFGTSLYCTTLFFKAEAPVKQSTVSALEELDKKWQGLVDKQQKGYEEIIQRYAKVVDGWRAAYQDKCYELYEEREDPVAREMRTITEEDFRGQ